MESDDSWILTEDLHLPHGQGDPLSAAVRASRIPMMITDVLQPDNPIIFANDAFLKMTGYDRTEVTGRNCRFLQGPETDPQSIAKLRQAVRQREDIALDILNYRKDGTAFWNALHMSPVRNADGSVQYFFSSQIDATERKQQELDVVDRKQELEWKVAARTLELEGALSRTKLLVHEVDHRVKNNLQMIGAMLMIQSMSIPDVRIKNTLEEMLGRVEAMGLVHKRLYQSDDFGEFDIAQFTQEIAGNLVAASGRDDIDLMVEAVTVKIKPDAAACVALVINEAITNALKHAFPIGRPGDLHVTVKPARGACEIRIRDDGIGMPAGAAPRTSFGRTLIETLVEQLKATIEWLPAYPGTVVRITLPLM